MNEQILDLNSDGIDRRGFLECMAWAGTGVVFSMFGGVLRSTALSDLLGHSPGAAAAREALKASSFNFVQISDSHIGFSKAANQDVIGTLKAAVDQINAHNLSPELLLHTGDLSHLSKDAEFDAMDQVLKGVHTSQMFFVPGEHDVLEDNGKNYHARYGKSAAGDGWYSFDHRGVHFVALINVLNLKAGGFGALGEAQLKWLEDDLKGRSASTPIVVFAHVPLWTVYPDWGWGTEDAARALELLKRFGSVTVLNGHIHQTMQKVEGNIAFHTARSTAFPQPAPGQAKGPGPLTVPADQLRSMLGVTAVRYIEHQGSLAIVDTTLAGTTLAGTTATIQTESVNIDNFAFAPATTTIKRGTTVRWTNRDDIPHTVAEANLKFKSPVLDTNDAWSHTFTETGEVAYFCTLHPHMTGKLRVE
jgi:plastocyanin